jgi:vesicle transport protein SEC22
MIASFRRPYAAIDFEPRMAQIRNAYLDPHSPGNVQKLNQDLNEIRNIMCQNIQEVLHRGEKLSSVSSKSSHLLHESKKFDKLAKYMNWQYWLKTVGPLIAVFLIVLVILYWKFFM